MRVSKSLSFWRAHKLHLIVAGLVILLHAALLYALWRARADNLPAAEPVFADVIVERPPAPAPLAAKLRLGEGVKTSAVTPAVNKSRAAQTPVVATPLHAQLPTPAETIAPSQTIATKNGAPGDKQQVVSAGIPVASDVSLACPVRTAPVYPRSARRLGETGQVRLRVELDETGRLVSSEVAQSSGFARLDEAALAAVKRWRCHPAMRDGQPLRIVSIESFEFNLGD